MIELNICPLCGSNKSHFFDVYSKPKVMPEIQSICLACSLVFKRIRMSNSELRTYYLSDEYSKVDRGNKSPTKKILSEADCRAKARYNCLKSIIKEGMKTLDIGSGCGRFVKLLSNKGCRSEGVDLSSSFVQFCRKQRLNIKLLEFPLESHTQYDIVSLFHVLEHLPDIHKAMQCCYNIIKHGGWLIVECPDLERYSLREGSSGRLFRNRSHLYDFTKDIMVKLFASYGFETKYDWHGFDGISCSDKNCLLAASKTSKISRFIPMGVPQSTIDAFNVLSANDPEVLNISCFK